MKVPSGWTKKKIQDLIDRFDAGVSVNGGDRPSASDEIGVLKVSAVTDGKFRPSENKVILPHEIKRVNLSPKQDRIIMSRANTPELVAAKAYIDRDYPSLFLSDKLWQFEPKENVQFSMRWLSQVLGSTLYQRKLADMATGTSQSMKNISQRSVMHLDLLAPPYQEQERLAKILTIWDTAVEKTEQLIKVKENCKRDFSYKLLFGKVRLNGKKANQRLITARFSVPNDWHIVKIGSVAIEVIKKNIDGNDSPVLSCTKYQGLVDSLRYFNKQIFSKDTSTYKIVERGQFAYATNHIEEGSIGYQNLYPKGLVSPMYTVFKTDQKRVNDGYLYKLLKTETFRHVFQVNTSASVDRRGSLRWNGFAKLPIPLPSLDEQKEINEVLETAQKEIDLLTRHVELLKKQKRGLMQKFLTGEWRVKAD